MPRGIRAGWDGKTARPVQSTFAAPMLADAEARFDGAVTYEEVIRRQGGRYDPETGRFVRIVPDGSYRPSQQANGKWTQPHQKRFIASSLEEARENGMMWDFYAMGLKCKVTGCNSLLTGWVRGGRKFEIEHEHISYGPQGMVLEYEVAAPDDDATPVAVGSDPPSGEE